MLTLEMLRKRDRGMFLTGTNSSGTMMLQNGAGVYWSPISIRINTKGWRTQMVKTRFNQVSALFKLGFRVFQYKYEWCALYEGHTFAFRDGVLTLERRTPCMLN